MTEEPEVKPHYEIRRLRKISRMRKTNNEIRGMYIDMVAVIIMGGMAIICIILNWLMCGGFKGYCPL